MTLDATPQLLPRDHVLLQSVGASETLWRTISPSRHIRADEGDVVTFDEGVEPRKQLKSGAVDLRGDGASVWRPLVLSTAGVSITDIYVGEYVGLASSTRQRVEDCVLVKSGCDPERPFSVVADPYPPEQEETPKFAAHALVVFSPRQAIGRGLAETRIAQIFELVSLGTVPEPLADEI